MTTKSEIEKEIKELRTELEEIGFDEFPFVDVVKLNKYIALFMAEAKLSGFNLGCKETEEEWKGKIENARTDLLKEKHFNNTHDETHKDRIHFSIVDKLFKNLLKEGEKVKGFIHELIKEEEHSDEN